jgi:general secretion pathway protein D
VAADVASVVGDFVAEEQQKLLSTFAGDESRLGSAARLLEREITIQGDTTSNSVLVSASPRYMDRVKEMIRQLDVDPPQVLIQVMLAEITLDEEDQWGVDARVAANIGSAAVEGAFGLASAFVPGAGVPSVTVAASDFDLLIRALNEQGRLQLLSNPSVMAANNQPARIQIGETIRVAESSSFTEAGNSNTNTVEKETGVILEVTPSINPDGFVRLDVAPTLSALSGETTQINESLETPIITIRTATTTVTVHDGQTIVIGGLVQDRFERRDRKVPFFGDIPIIGKLFRAEDMRSRTTELLIVITPHVLESPTDYARVEELTNQGIDRLSLPPVWKERMKRGGGDYGGLIDEDGKPIILDFDGNAEGVQDVFEDAGTTYEQEKEPPPAPEEQPDG